MKKRQPTQRREAPWPFLYTVNERGVVKNLPPTPRKVFTVKSRKPVEDAPF